MSYDKKYWRTIGIALLPALGVSVAVVLVGGLFNVSESAVNRISQLLFFPIFLAACYYVNDRQSETKT